MPPRMSSLHRPQLRPYLAAARLDPRHANGKELVLYDRLRLTSAHLPLTAAELECLKLFDGTRTLLDIQADVIQMLGGQIVPLEAFTGLTDRLDQALFLDTPRFRAAAEGPVRKPACHGVYSP